MKLKIVDAGRIRNTLDTDFSSWGDKSSYPYIPAGELWIDNHLKPEAKFFGDLSALERRLKGKPFKSIRQAAIKQFTDRKAKPTIIEHGKHRGLKVLLLDGASVRRSLDPYFVLGGHDLVYSYIPKNEVWIDSCQADEEIRYTLTHELFERSLMAKGMNYDDAHDFALAAERQARRQDGVADFIRG